MGLLFKPKEVGKGRKREQIKIIVLINSYRRHNRKFQRNSKKIQKIKKHHYGFTSSQNRNEMVEKERKQKLLFRSISTRPEIENFKKIAIKFRKL